MLDETTIPFLRQGIQVTLWLTVLTSVLSLALGVCVGIGRLSPNRPIQRLSAAFVAVHRNVPALMLIIFWAFAVPNLVSAEARQIIFFNNRLTNWIADVTNLSIPYYAFAAAFALTLNTSAYIAELFRAGVGTIAQQQFDAARSLGASQSIVLREIIVPQGIRVAWPTISTRLIHNMKNTALASFVSVPEFFNSTQGIINKTFQAGRYLLVAALVYLVLSFVMARLLNWVERQLMRRRVSHLFAADVQPSAA